MSRIYSGSYVILIFFAHEIVVYNDIVVATNANYIADIFLDKYLFSLHEYDNI